MEPISKRVRDMYEQFPYPTRATNDLFDSHPRLCLSYRHGYRHKERLTVLDAGCGTGACSLGTALYNRDCQVVAADFNREALKTIQDEAEGLALSNLVVSETDLNTLRGLEVPTGGFDVIVCGGVLHHLADPVRGLSNLAGALAPGGVMRLFVYNTLGRQALYRFVEALNLIQLDSDRPSLRLDLARSFFRSVVGGPLRQAPWGDGGDIDDIEFVDRYLHPKDSSYSVAQYMQMLDDANLVFLRWHEPSVWDLSRYIADPEVLDQLLEQPKVVQYQLVEHLSNQMMLDGYVAHKGSLPQNHSRGLEGLIVEQNPQVVLQVCQQSNGGISSDVSPRAYLRARPSIALEWGEFKILRRLTRGPVRAEDLATDPDQHRRLVNLLEAEMVYSYMAGDPVGHLHSSSPDPAS